MNKSIEPKTSKENVVEAINGLDDNNKKIISDFLAAARMFYMPEKLVYAAIDQFGLTEFLEKHETIRDDGITSGFYGYSYHADTVPFFEENQSDIISWLKERNGNVFGYDSIINIFKDSQYVKGLSIDEMNEALYAFDNSSYEHQTVANLLSWMVGEQICYELYHFMAEKDLALTQ